MEIIVATSHDLTIHPLADMMWNLYGSIVSRNKRYRMYSHKWHLPGLDHDRDHNGHDSDKMAMMA